MQGVGVHRIIVLDRAARALERFTSTMSASLHITCYCTYNQILPATGQAPQLEPTRSRTCVR